MKRDQGKLEQAHDRLMAAQMDRALLCNAAGDMLDTLEGWLNYYETLVRIGGTLSQAEYQLYLLTRAVIKKAKGERVA